MALSDDSIRGGILSTLSQHKVELTQRFGVKQLSIFGSVARGEATPQSDLDVLVEFDGPASSDRFFGLQFYLEDLLRRRIDLVTDKALRPELRPYVEKDAMRVC